MHSYAHTELNSGTSKWASRQTARQTLTCICPRKGFFFTSSFLSRLTKQTGLSRSLYSCADFCVSVCFNLNGFQVPLLPNFAHRFCLDLVVDIKTFSLSPMSFSHLLLSLKRHHIVSSITLLFTSVSSFGLTPKPSFPSVLDVKMRWISQCSLGANVLQVLTSRVQEVTLAGSLFALMGSDQYTFMAAEVNSHQLRI